MPDNYYFRQPSTQDMLLDILFVWAKLNPDVKYRQGMHEVLAPIVWAMERDAIQPSTLPADTQGNQPMETTFDATFVEHDSFTIFNIVMQNIKSAYETSPVASSKPSPSGRAVSQQEPPMVVRGRRIIEHDLAQVDPALSQRLIRLEVHPQIFLLRWIRLLFGREFPFDHVLMLWDALFAEDPSLESVDLICLSMLLRIRWQLVDADYNTALTLVLKYPELPSSQPPSTLVADASYLRTHFTLEGGAHVIGKNTGRPPPLVNRPRQAENGTGIWTASPLPEPDSVRLGGRGANFEAIVQDAAKSIFARGEKWGVNKAVRDAVGEVRKNVNQLQTQARHSRNVSTVSRASDAGDDAAHVREIKQLQQRNMSLAKMLENAVSDLWEHHKTVAEKHAENAESTEKLTLAIAKVQLAQVYLEDSSLPLPVQDEGNAKIPAADDANSRVTDDIVRSEPETCIEKDAMPPKSDGTASPRAAGGGLPTTPTKQPTRPALHDSPFSWMLGQEEKGLMSPRSAFISASPFQAREASASRLGDSLFGDPVEDVPVRNQPAPSSKSKGKAKSKAQVVKPEEDVFDLGSFEP